MNTELLFISDKEMETLDRLYNRIDDASRTSSAKGQVESFFDYLKYVYDNPYHSGFDKLDNALNKFDKTQRELSGAAMDYVSGQTPGTSNIRNDYIRNLFFSWIDGAKERVGTWVGDVAEQHRSRVLDKCENKWREMAGADYPEVIDQNGNAIDFWDLRHQWRISLRDRVKAEKPDSAVEQTSKSAALCPPVLNLQDLIYSESSEDRIRAAKAGLGLDVLRFDSDERVRDAVWEQEHKNAQTISSLLEEAEFLSREASVLDHEPGTIHHGHNMEMGG